MDEIVKSIDINIDVFDKLDLLKKLEPVANDIGTETVLRTTQGGAVDGGRLRAYSRGYAQKKELAGRGSNVNLTWTGQLLRSIEVKNTKNAITVFFNGKHLSEVALANREKRRKERERRKAEAKTGGAQAKADKAKELKAQKTKTEKKAKSGAKKQKGAAVKRSQSNAALAVALEAKGFKFFGITQKEIKRIDETIEKAIDDAVRNGLFDAF